MSSSPKTSDVIAARRRFLAACGKFAVATPPAVSLMLSAANRNYAVAGSGSAGGTSGGGGGGGGGTNNISNVQGNPFQNNLNPGGAANNCNSPSLNAVSNRSNCRL